MDTIVTIGKYYADFVKYVTVFKIVEDIDMFDWAVAQVVRKYNQWHLRFSMTKRFLVKCGTATTAKIVVQGETGYNFSRNSRKCMPFKQGCGRL